MKIPLLLTLIFATFSLTVFGNENKVIKYNIFLKINNKSSNIAFSKYSQRFIYEAIISTGKFNIIMGTTPLVNKKSKKVFFVINAILKEGASANTTNIRFTLTRFPKDKMINQITNDNITSQKMLLTLRQMAYQLLYGKLYNENAPKPRVIPLHSKIPDKKKTPPNIITNSQHNTDPLSEQIIANKLSEKSKPRDKPKKKLATKQRKKRINNSKINNNYKAPNITQRKKIKPPKMKPRIWHSKYNYSAGYSQFFIESESSILKTETTIRSTIFSAQYNRKTYDDYSNSTFNISLERPIYKLKYKIPMLYEFGYKYHFNAFREIIFLSPFINYSKGYFVNLIYFGESINVLPLTNVWMGLSLTLDYFIKLRMSYGQVMMGNVNYKGVTAPVSGNKIDISADLSIYKRWGLRASFQKYMINTSLGNTSNQFTKATFNILYSL